MCEYCIQHGSGKKWYFNARNYAKKLARSDFVKEFSISYFNRQILPKSRTKTESNLIDDETRKKTDFYYKQLLHHQVIAPDEVYNILKVAYQQSDEDEKTIVQLPCICRFTELGSDESFHCFGIAFTAEYTKKFPDYLGGGHRYIDLNTAVSILEKMTSSEQIVHSISALGVPYIGLLCNCDMKVCHPYHLRKKMAISSPMSKGHKRAKVNSQKCVGCGTCVEVCPFNVPQVDPQTNLSEIDSNLCFGCGICMNSCLEEAIELSLTNINTW